VEAYLAQHPRVAAVFWPGSERHPQHALAQRQMRNYSGMIAFSSRSDGAALARRCAERLRVISYAVSMGKTKSLLFYIPTDEIQRSSFHLTSEQEGIYRDWTGEGTFRVSVGLEDAQDLIEDLAQAL
jgi:cystathionine gamma-synthase/methionine-gamma-lyase